MILDTSALVAVLRDEPEAPAFTRAMEAAAQLQMSAANVLESAIVIDGARNPRASRLFDDFLRRARVQVEPVTAAQVDIAREAYRDFGKGSGHPAQLNFGDCFAYALAKSKGETLLYKGGDFSLTDLRSAAIPGIGGD